VYDGQTASVLTGPAAQVSPERFPGSVLQGTDELDLEDELQWVYSRDHLELRRHHIFTNSRQQQLPRVLHPFQSFEGCSFGPEVHSLIPLGK